MNVCRQKIYAVAIVLGVSFLCCCAAPHTKTTSRPLSNESAIRLPYGTDPLTIEQTTPPPPGAAQTIVPTEAQEGMSRSLRLFQIDLGHTKTDPVSTKEKPGLPETTP